MAAFPSLTRRSAPVAVVFVAVEAFTALALSVGGIDKVSFWIPFVAAVAAFAVLVSPLAAGDGETRPLTRNVVAGVSALLFALALGGMAGVLGQGRLLGLGIAFAAALAAGEICAAAAWIAGFGERAATASSLFAAALSTTAIVMFAERMDLAQTATGIGVGGLLASVQLACARAADGAVEGRFDRDALVAAAAARFSEVPRNLTLAMVGPSNEDGRHASRETDA